MTVAMTFAGKNAPVGRFGRGKAAGNDRYGGQKTAMNALTFNRLLGNIKDDAQAIVPLYEEFYPRIVLHLQRRFGKLICHEDIAAEVFATLMEAGERTFVRCPAQWLFKIADHKAVDFLRKRHEEFSFTDAINEENVSEDICLRGADVQRAFAHIDPLSRSILYMRFWEGRRYKEIACELHMGCGNVRTKASRAYKILKKYL